MPLPQPVSLRDRTPEFLLLCERLQKAQQQGSSAAQAAAAQGGAASASTASPVPPARAAVQQHSEFARRAADIGHAIQRTSAKLAKLAQLAKRTSMFDDPAAEVNELTFIIKQDIQALNASLSDLQRLSAVGKGGAEQNKQSLDHSHTVVDSLRSRLKDATQEFKDVLTVRTDSLKHHKERRQLFSSAGAGGDAEALPLLAPHHAHHAHHHHHAPLPPSSSPSFASTSAASPAPAPVPSFLQTQQQQQQQQLALVAPQDTYLSSRAQALQNVESTIVELGGIFNKLSEMVSQQGEMAIRIDENIEDTLSNVTGAQAQLLKYLNTISSNRWLVLKVFGVMMFFLIIFIMFIA